MATRTDSHQSGAVRVLLLLDHRMLASTLGPIANHRAFATRSTNELADAIVMLREWRPHVAVFDLDIAGERLVEPARGRTGPSLRPRLPMLAVTRRNDLKTKLAAFDAGVDDIMTIPLSPEELLARVIALARRAYGEAATFMPVIRAGELEINILDREVWVASSRRQLSDLEQNLLYVFAANPGRVLTRDQIIDALWGVDHIAESNIVDRHIRNLRAKLGDNWREPRFIATVRGRGYRFLPGSEDA